MQEPWHGGGGSKEDSSPVTHAIAGPSGPMHSGRGCKLSGPCGRAPPVSQWLGGLGSADKPRHGKPCPHEPHAWAAAGVGRLTHTVPVLGGPEPCVPGCPRQKHAHPPGTGPTPEPPEPPGGCRQAGTDTSGLMVRWGDARKEDPTTQGPWAQPPANTNLTWLWIQIH